MLAYRERLVRFDGLSAEAEAYSGLIGPNIFATAGHEPSDSQSLAFDQWIEFMGVTQQEVPPASSKATTGSGSPSLLQRIVNALARVT